jgi:tRNA A37 threonylcarbamoyltransferase TsaD
VDEKFPDVDLLMPTHELSTDNAVMIAMASYIDVLCNPEKLKNTQEIKAKGNLSVSAI